MNIISLVFTNDPTRNKCESPSVQPRKPGLYKGPGRLLGPRPGALGAEPTSRAQTATTSASPISQEVTALGRPSLNFDPGCG